MQITSTKFNRKNEVSWTQLTTLQYLGKEATDFLRWVIVLEQWRQCDNYLFVCSLGNDIVILHTQIITEDQHQTTLHCSSLSSSYRHQIITQHYDCARHSFHSLHTEKFTILQCCKLTQILIPSKNFTKTIISWDFSRKSTIWHSSTVKYQFLCHAYFSKMVKQLHKFLFSSPKYYLKAIL